MRRATIEDLQGLVALWESMNLPAMELERRLTDFQVAEGPDGSLIGAIGMEISGRHGRIHSEAFNDFSLADPLRQKLCDRFHALATNHGLTRVWTVENAPFWRHSGFNPADEPTLKKLPEPWTKHSVKWLTHCLRNEEVVENVIEKEFARFVELEKESTAKVMGRARILNHVALVVAVILAFLVALYVFVVRFHGHLPGR